MTVYQIDRFGHMACVGRPALKQTYSIIVPAAHYCGQPRGVRLWLDLRTGSGYSAHVVVPPIAVCWSTPITGGDHRMPSIRPIRPSLSLHDRDI